MARRSPGQRFQPVQGFVDVQQAAGQTNAREALRQFRTQGGTIRTQEWYRVWREQQKEAEHAPPTTYDQNPSQPIRGWLTDVRIVYLDPATGKQTYGWRAIRSDGPLRMDDADAITEAIDEGADEASYRGQIPVVAYVVAYEAIH